MKNKADVSIIIPVYNTEKYLRKCLESCINQSLEDVEIIIVDDGSTDNSFSIEEEYKKKSTNINIIRIENSGLSVARNTGLAMATGKYVFFCDSDDWLNENSLKEAFECAEKYNLEIVLFDAKVICDGFQSNVSYSRYGCIDALNVYSGIKYVEHVGENERVSAWLQLTRRDFLEKNNISFLKDAIYEDHKFYMDCMVKALRVRYLPQQLYNYRVRKNSIMTSQITLAKIISPYMLCYGMVETVENSNISLEQKLFWMEYIASKIRTLIYISYYGVSKESIQQLIGTHYPEIEKEQICFMKKYWGALRNIVDNPSRITLILHCIENAVSGLGVVSEKERKFVNEIFEYHKKYVEEELRKLPLNNPNQRVGVYGIGKHTWGLLQNYKTYVGNIESSLVYIDSNVTSYTKRIDESDVINIADVSPDLVDVVLISSYLHENEMKEKAQQIIKDKLPIVTIYDGKKYWIDTDTENENEIKNRILSYKEKIDEKRIYVIAVPDHANTGDHLISLAVKKYLNKYFRDFDIVEITGTDFRENRNNVVGMISRLDTLLILGGGFFGSLWPDGETIEKALEWFPDNRIIILPQSLFFDNSVEGQRALAKIKQKVTTHQNLKICYREHISFKRGTDLFGKEVKQYLLPDMALTYGKVETKANRNGITLCLRNDKESVLDSDDKSKIKQYVYSLDKHIHETSMQWERYISPSEASTIVDMKMNEISSARLVISDALHCIITCALTGTPCVALPSVTGKTEGVYQWIKSLPYIRYISKNDKESFFNDFQIAVNQLIKNKQEFQYDLDFTRYEEELEKIIRD